ncbi:MAG: cobalamin-binding protein [Firmicutes bacterium]|nr:cobalamin-binding protein [Bacillota bacterium]
MEKVLNEISEALQAGDVNTVQEKIKEALEAGLTPREVLNDGLLSGMNIIGEKFKNNEVFVPEVLIAARAMNGGMEILKPKLIETGVESIGKVIIGTVKGDLHDIGKNLVKMMMEGAGFDVVDLGTDISPEQFVEAVKEHKPNIVGLSALLTTTMPQMKETIKALEESGLRNQVFVMIGGAPVTDKYAEEIGADAYSKDAASAAAVAKKKVS